MQWVKIYNDLLHLTGEWMNEWMLICLIEGRKTTLPPLSLSLSLSLFFLGGANVPTTPSGFATVTISHVLTLFVIFVLIV
jgi:hypothetical protein